MAGEDEFGDFEDATIHPQGVSAGGGAHSQGSNNITTNAFSRNSQPIPLEFFGEDENATPNTTQSTPASEAEYAYVPHYATFC